MNENTDTRLEARIVLRLILDLVQNVTSTVFDLHFCWNIERYTEISNEERCTFATSFPPLLRCSSLTQQLSPKNLQYVKVYVETQLKASM